ncbi:hypothetical protein GCM10009847_08170 [Leucobacter tardus]|uniref:EAL domain-containing protein n=1 Tax=Leucobacter tardus TaxID=501483 RepID=A0A939QF53_9MICO|nr:GGDEF domain-containing phosphodiesterase [Leucobacter tardus]MBO2989018.1 EAL domain-containing protein [Leucobacter tardus]
MDHDVALFRYLVDAVEDYSIYLLSPSGIVQTWNRGAQRIKGYAAAEIVGRSFATFFSDEDRAHGEPEQILAAARAHGRFETEGWRVRKNGSRFWAHVTVNAVTDEQGVFIGFAKITRDVTVARETTSALHRAASTDALTGLSNRTTFFAALEAWVDSSAPFAVSLIDLNDFKRVNDTHGHSVGDELLRASAMNLRRGEDHGVVVARLGGDEFAVAALTPDQQALTSFMHWVSGVMREPLGLGEHRGPIAASVGVARYPVDGHEVSELLMRADAAMYTAKEQSSEAAVLYSEGLLEVTSSRRYLGRRVPAAVAGGEFELQYQPQSSLRSSAVVGWEALVRWRHPVLGLLAPDAFIPIAEANGTIVELGTWVLRHACHDAAQWQEPARIAVNVSAAQLVDADFVPTVARALADSGLEPHRLELEITESTLIAHRRDVIEKFAAIQAMGALIALDDFGSGFSSLDTLLAFNFDRVKIDRSVLQSSLQPLRTRNVLRAILALGHALTASVLVEGVETEQQRDLLRTEGFDEIQGFLTGAPGIGPKLRAMLPA